MSVDICYNHNGTQLLKKLSVSHHVLFLSLLYKILVESSDIFVW